MDEILKLEKLRRSVIAKYKIYRIFAAISGGILSFGFMMYIFPMFQAQKDAALMYFLAFMIIFFVFYSIAFKNFKEKGNREFRVKYKNMYIAPYVKKLGFKYDVWGFVNATDIITSRIFPSFSFQNGNDKISGDIDGVHFEFSDLILQDESTRNGENDEIFNWMLGRSDGYDYRVKDTLFKGIFFVADFFKRINSHTLVVSNPSSAGTEGLNKINMDNTEFNREFFVFSDDLQNAMYILSPSLMEKILLLKKQMKSDIAISFIGTKIFIRVDREYDSFEPDVDKKVITNNLDKTIKKDLNAFLDIVKILGLNAKIWIA
ncbi:MULTISPECIES: DUF3137 domain-containing protein [Campylobacter]|uniref:DUF3137 domain-containing protein n=1 Tax=Campylobacter TaxID=194 RepID=UPI0023F3F8DD|nr:MULTISPECIES: DUF3137 domain-containing protein [Campylobacter]MCI6641102.1 DUF3137 domain-containing protein [Campylobacter sp.]MDD7421863.1 DUF3137 domain-containing protein [Campylobacter hominis]MDY3117419.1 DUF3137 domain-containing protein [Campylobacter hominis]